jgi:hypothetical protein
MSKVLPFQRLLDFQLEEDGVRTKDGLFTFYRYYPPNMDIMTAAEVQAEIEKFASLLDAIKSEITIFATDKVEDLAEVKDFYLSMPEQFDYLTADILAAMENSEVQSAAVQRAFYFITRDDPDGGRKTFNTIRGKGYHIEVTKKAELAVVLRNYLLREFQSTDIYTIEKEIKENPKNKRMKQTVFAQQVFKRLAPGRMDFGVRNATQSGLYRRTVMVKNYPSEVDPCTLQDLAHLRGTSVTLRLTPMVPAEVRRLTNRQIKNKNIVVRDRNAQGTDQIEAVQEEKAIREFYEDISAKRGTIYRINVFVEMYGKTQQELDNIEDAVNGALAARGITKENLWHEQREGFLSVNPLGKDHFLLEANNLPSLSGAALYPCSYSSRLDPQGMLLGETVDGGMMFVDFLKRDGNITTSNFTIIGSSGQGKSYLMKKIIAFLYMRGVKCFVFDPENEYVDLTRKLGGTVVDCASGRVKINPFEVRRLRRQDDVVNDDEKDDYDIVPVNTTTFFQHLSWLQDFFSVLFPSMGVPELKALMILVREMYEAAHVGEESDFETLRPEDYPTFTDLYNYVEQRSGADYKMISKEYLSTLLLYLHDCTKGALGLLLNGTTNIQNDRLMVFAMNDLLQGSDERTRAVLFNISTYLWNIITRKEGPVMLNVDELYTLCDSKNMVMVKYFQSFSKRSRKYEALLGIGTQQLADCLNPEIAVYTTALFNNASFKFMFYPDAIDLALIQQKLKLTDGEAACISKSNKKHCLLIAGNDRYYMRVGTLPYEEELFGNAGGR